MTLILNEFAYDTANELLYNRRSKNRTSLARFMALSQRLQLRQSQALVMTPQLMQAIKLLQLSNLDLVAYVEAELERNPLLDRGARTRRRAGEPDGAQSPGRSRPPTARRWNGSEPRSRPSAAAKSRPRDARSTILARRCRADPAAQRGDAGGLFGMGRRRLRRPRRRRLQSGSVRLRRDHAGGLAARAAQRSRLPIRCGA